MTQQQEAKAMSWPRRMLGWLMLLGVIFLSMGIGFYLTKPWSAEPSSEPANPGNVVAAAIALAVLGVFALGVAIGVYGLMYATQGLTFNYSRPVWKGFNVRRWTANIVVGVLGCGGLALMAAAVLMPVMTMLGVSEMLALMLGLVLPFILLQLLQSAVDIWAPLGRPLVIRRMRALGLPPGSEAGAILMGYSNPDSKAAMFKFVQPLSDEIGLLWLAPNELHFVGDSGRFTLPRGQVTAIERNVSGTAWASYFGGRDVILACQSTDGSSEYKLRLHPYELRWTLPSQVREMDELADNLNHWLVAVPTEASDTTDDPAMSDTAV